MVNYFRLNNPTADEYNIIKKEFAQLFNEYHFLLVNEIWQSKYLYFSADMKICRFNLITVCSHEEWTNPECSFIDLDFVDFITLAVSRKKIFTAEEEKAWREDLTNETAIKLTEI